MSAGRMLNVVYALIVRDADGGIDRNQLRAKVKRAMIEAEQMAELQQARAKALRDG